MASARRAVPLRKLLAAGARSAAGDPLPCHATVDPTRPFLCPTLVPLHYTQAAEWLSPAHMLRANQLNGLYFNEVITFFETSFAPAALRALARAAPDEDLHECLTGFLADEERHSAMFRRLNRLSAPAWYEASPFRFLALAPGVRLATALLTRRAASFPALVWVMLAAEEHSIEVSRRCATATASLDPSWAAVWRAHAVDEVRHVQVDLHLVERFHGSRARWERRANAAVVAFVLSRLLLAPRRSSDRILAQLVLEFPELRPRQREIRDGLRALGASDAYQSMMYSRETTPLTFAAFDRHPEFHAAARALRAYTPLGAATRSETGA